MVEKRKYGGRVVSTCPECKREFWTIPSRPSKFCSRECYLKHGNSGQFSKGLISWNKGKINRKLFPSKVCPICGKNFDRRFYVSYKIWLKTKYCSSKCAGMGKRKGDYSKKTYCKICNKVMTKNKGSWKDFLNRKYCSLKCKGIAIRGNRSLNWNGGKVRHGNGYVGIFTPKHPYARKTGYVMEHRLNIEKEIGRYLLLTEIIHHLDGNKGNNKIHNLLLCKDKSEHKFVHVKMETFMFKLIQEGKAYYDKEKKEFMETKS